MSLIPIGLAPICFVGEAFFSMYTPLFIFSFLLYCRWLRVPAHWSTVWQGLHLLRACRLQQWWVYQYLFQSFVQAHSSSRWLFLSLDYFWTKWLFSWLLDVGALVPNCLSVSFHLALCPFGLFVRLYKWLEAMQISLSACRPVYLSFSCRRPLFVSIFLPACLPSLLACRRWPLDTFVFSFSWMRSSVATVLGSIPTSSDTVE